MIPGFVDLQINGWGGVDFSSPSLTEEECNTAFDQIGEWLKECLLVQHDAHASRVDGHSPALCVDCLNALVHAMRTTIIVILM
jgi:hypothetical protein